VIPIHNALAPPPHITAPHPAAVAGALGGESSLSEPAVRPVGMLSALPLVCLSIGHAGHAAVVSAHPVGMLSALPLVCLSIGHTGHAAVVSAHPVGMLSALPLVCLSIGHAGHAAVVSAHPVGMLSALPWSATALAAVAAGQAADWLVERRRWRVVDVRRLAQTVATLGAVCLSKSLGL
jgi:hypothetical protein